MILRCSSLPLAMRCPGAVHNDGGVLIDDWCDASEDGTDIHRLLATHPEGDAPKELVAELSDEARILYYTGAKMWREHISAWMPDSFAEVHFEEDEVFFNEEGPSIPGDKLDGHVDRIALPDDSIVILDWKNGRKDIDHKHQGFGYAFKALRRFKSKRKATVHFAWTRTQELESYTVDRDRAIAWGEEMQDRIADWDGVFHPGDHCTHCRRHATCPAHQAMNRQSLALVTGQTVDLASMPSPELATLYRRLLPLASQIESLQEAIKAESITRGGINDGSGRILHYREENGPREVDTLKVWDHLRAKMEDKELAACLKVRLGEVEAVLAKKAGKGNGAKAKRELDAKLKELGAMKQEKRSKFVDERKE